MMRITLVLMDAEMNVIPQRGNARRSWMVSVDEYVDLRDTTWAPRNIVNDMASDYPFVCAYADVKIDALEHNSNEVWESNTYSYEVYRGKARSL